MKVSEVTNAQIADYLRLDPDEIPAEIEPIRKAAVEYMKSYTGMDDAELDGHEEFYIALLVLCQDMYDNRAMTAANGNINRTVSSILDMHRKNLL